MLSRLVRREEVIHVASVGGYIVEVLRVLVYGLPDLSFRGYVATPNRVTQLEQAVERILRDRREPDKVLGYCLTARPDLVESISGQARR